MINSSRYNAAGDHNGDLLSERRGGGTTCNCIEAGPQCIAYDGTPSKLNQSHNSELYFPMAGAPTGKIPIDDQAQN